MRAFDFTKVLAAAVFVALAPGSCVTEESIDCVGELRFGVSTESDFFLDPDTRAIFEPSTRAPVNSAEAVQSIADVKVHAFRTYDGGGTFRYIRSWDLSSRWSPGATSATYNVQPDEMVDPGNYRFLAVGMDTPAGYTLPPMTPGTTVYSDIAATLASPPPAAQEIFSGYRFRVIRTGTQSVAITMVRRVAGVLLYVVNVPTVIGTQPTAYLRLAMVRSNTVVDITSRPSDAVPPALASQPGYNIFDIDLRAQGDANNDGLWDGSPAVGGVAKLAATTLAGAYVLPARANAADGNTLVLSLVAADGITALRSWVVRSPSSTGSYDILPNNLYSIGRKLQTASTTDDAPIDLSQSLFLTATIIPHGEQTHRSVLDQR
jgi:hypothetical protein